MEVRRVIRKTLYEVMKENRVKREKGKKNKKA
jgi:hypothetical protein